MLSELIKEVAPSAIIETFDRAYKLRQQGVDLIDFSVGEPDFDTPLHIREAGIAAINQGVTRYTPSDGTSELKAAVVRKFKRDNGLNFDPSCIVVGAGAKPLLAAAAQSILNPGDEVILPTPLWASHLGMVQTTGAIPHLVPPQNAEFKLSAESLRKSITEKTRLLMLCSPSNPTGTVYNKRELNELADVLRAYPKILIMSDDLYEHIIFDDKPFVTLAQVAPDLQNRILTVNGVSKAYAMTGWRIGFAGGPEWWIEGIRTIFSQTSGGPSSISQSAAVAALDGPQDFLKLWCSSYQDRRDITLTELAKIEGLKVKRPDGAFYVMPECGALLGKQTPDGFSINSSTDLANYLLDNGVVVVPGPGFSCDPFFRISFAISTEMIQEGISRMAIAINQLS